MTTERKPLDAWLRFDTDDSEEAEEAEAEANTFLTDDGEYCVEWYLNSVGLVKRKWFDSYADARKWLESEGFGDYSS